MLKCSKILTITHCATYFLWKRNFLHKTHAENDCRNAALVATVVFRLAQTKIVTLKTQLHAVNARWKRVSQRSFSVFLHLYLCVHVCARERCKFVITSFFEKNYFAYTNKQADFDGKKMTTAVIVT